MINLKRMLEIQHQNNRNKKEILKKIKKIDKELNLERIFPIGYKDIEIVNFEITGNEKDAIKLKNVAGEIFGAITIMKAARKLKLKRIKLYFDFSGIEDIALGKIKPKQKNRFLQKKKRRD